MNRRQPFSETRLAQRVARLNQTNRYAALSTKTAQMIERNWHASAENEKLLPLAYTDPLGINNRNAGIDAFQQTISQLSQPVIRQNANRRRSPNKSKKILGFLALDLDGFKKINDTLGHSIGDQALIHFGKTYLEKVIRKEDKMFRWAGDEFGVILRASSEKQVWKAAARILKEVTNYPFKIADRSGHQIEIVMSTSIGFCVVDAMKEQPDFTTVWDRADQALYEAKRRGKGQIAMYRGDCDMASFVPQQVGEDGFKQLSRRAARRGNGAKKAIELKI